MAICPFAEWVPAPDWKHGYPSGDMLRPQGAVLHSAEGDNQASKDVLLGPIMSSWQFYICRDGTILQHMDSLRVAWHTKTRFGRINKTFWGIEAEGIAGEPLTDAQVESSIRLIRWLWAEHGLWEFSRQTLREHNEFTATACPSGRIPWDVLVPRLNEEQEVDLGWLWEVMEWLHDMVDQQKWADILWLLPELGLVHN